MDIRRLVSTLALAALAAAALPALTAPSAAQSFRAPVVLAIAPDVVNCDDPDDPDGVEDVTISGICFLDRIVGAFLSLNPDGSGDRVELMNVVNIGNNTVTATVPLSQLTAEPGTPYYVFVVRADGRESTPFPNVFGFDVTFTCVAGGSDGALPALATCRVVRTSSGRFVLQVTGENFRPNDSVVLLDGEPCRRNRYPSRFINPSDGTTTRIHCSGGLERLLPATVTVRNQSSGQTSTNSLTCDFDQ